MCRAAPLSSALRWSSLFHIFTSVHNTHIRLKQWGIHCHPSWICYYISFPLPVPKLRVRRAILYTQYFLLWPSFITWNSGPDYSSGGVVFLSILPSKLDHPLIRGHIWGRLEMSLTGLHCHIPESGKCYYRTSLNAGWSNFLVWMNERFWHVKFEKGSDIRQKKSSSLKESALLCVVLFAEM